MSDGTEKIGRRKFLKDAFDFSAGIAASAAFPINEAHGAIARRADRVRPPDLFPELDIKAEESMLIKDFLAKLALELEKRPDMAPRDLPNSDFARVADPYLEGYLRAFQVLKPGEKLMSPLGVINHALGIAFVYAARDPKLDRRVMECVANKWNDIAVRLMRATIETPNTVGSHERVPKKES